jgi:hypothetical protein
LIHNLARLTVSPSQAEAFKSYRPLRQQDINNIECHMKSLETYDSLVKSCEATAILKVEAPAGDITSANTLNHISPVVPLIATPKSRIEYLSMSKLFLRLYLMATIS